MMRQGVVLCVAYCLAMGWSKTVIISKDRRVIADLWERRGGQESKKEIPSKQLRKIPDY